MSVVVGIKSNDRIIVGCDDRFSSDDSYFDSRNCKSKAFVYKGKKDFIIGCVGNIAIADLFAPLVAKLEIINETTLLYTTIAFIDKYRYLSSIYDDSLNGALLIACGKDAYIIESNLLVRKISDHAAIGSGGMAALGALSALNHYSIDDETKVAYSVYAAGEVCLSVSQNVYIANTKELEFNKKRIK